MTFQTKVSFIHESFEINMSLYDDYIHIQGINPKTINVYETDIDDSNLIQYVYVPTLKDLFNIFVELEKECDSIVKLCNIEVKHDLIIMHIEYNCIFSFTIPIELHKIENLSGDKRYMAKLENEIETLYNVINNIQVIVLKSITNSNMSNSITANDECVMTTHQHQSTSSNITFRSIMSEVFLPILTPSIQLEHNASVSVENNKDNNIKIIKLPMNNNTTIFIPAFKSIMCNIITINYTNANQSYTNQYFKQFPVSLQTLKIKSLKGTTLPDFRNITAKIKEIIFEECEVKNIPESEYAKLHFLHKVHLKFYKSPIMKEEIKKMRSKMKNACIIPTVTF